MNILVIEDEHSLCQALEKLLKQNLYAVDVAYDGVTGEDFALTGKYDVILLDIMLPGKSVLDVLRSIREKRIATPVLLLTAKYEVEDKIHGFDLGAYDYLTKPFASGELMARIRAMTRRKGEFIGDDLEQNTTILRRRSHEPVCKGNMVNLGYKEYQIMELLMQNSRQVIPKETFLERIWGYENDSEYNAIESYISFLRKKLLSIQADVQIKTKRGVGYALEDLDG